MPSPVSAERLAWALEKLSRAFPRSYLEPKQRDGMAELWRDLLDQHEWITEPVFASGVFAIVWKHTDDFAPGPAVALDFFRVAERETRSAQAKVELERLEEQQAALKAGPDSSWGKKPGPERAAFLLRHLAIGKLRARHQHLDLNVPYLPPEEEIAAVEEEIRRSGFMRRALTRLAAGEDVSPVEFAASVYPPTRRSGK